MPSPKADGCPANAENPPPPPVAAGVVVVVVAVVAVVPNGLGVPANALNAPVVAGLITDEGVDVWPNAEVGAPCAGCPRADVVWGCEKADTGRALLSG